MSTPHLISFAGRTSKREKLTPGGLNKEEGIQLLSFITVSTDNDVAERTDELITLEIFGKQKSEEDKEGGEIETGASDKEMDQQEALHTETITLATFGLSSVVIEASREAPESEIPESKKVKTVSWATDMDTTKNRCKEEASTGEDSAEQQEIEAPSIGNSDEQVRKIGMKIKR